MTTPISGKRLRSVHVTPGGLYRIETFDNEVFEV